MSVDASVGCLFMLKNVIYGNIKNIIEQLRQAGYGAHYIIVYPDIMTLREIYSNYIRYQIEDKKEIVLVLSYYETVDNLRNFLSPTDEISSDLQRYEREGSLIIIDSVKGFFDFDHPSYVKSLLKQAESLGKSGISVIADAGAFYHYSKLEELVKHELSMPSKFDVNLKRFCVFHKQDFDRLTEAKKQKLLEHHEKDLIAVN
ncbi:MAG TPA: hypothetical protein VFY64_10680 [Nitrososphaeraceae archaeon]|nr:hypothetical protein [Nitrososphaeraceae archaeon]